MNAGVAALASLGCLGALALGCGDSRKATPASAGAPSGSAAASGAEPPYAPPRGMVWIPPGVLLAGTPMTQVPRVPDAELGGEQVVMTGFFIDRLPYPNEPGSIPTTHLSHAEARAICEDDGKRLCTELELERACKGPDNLPFSYGAAFDPEACGGELANPLSPTAQRPRCESAFGVRDLHGSAATWTASVWRRGSSPTERLVVRGGVGREAEVATRCAHAVARAPTERPTDVGVRCCAGPPNTFEVRLEVRDGPHFDLHSLDSATEARLAGFGEQSLGSATSPLRPYRVARAYRWRPAGNEELLVAAGCQDPPKRPKRTPISKCGVVIARHAGALLAFAATGHRQPTPEPAATRRELSVLGGDPKGAFRLPIRYDWGRVTVLGPTRLPGIDRPPD